MTSFITHWNRFWFRTAPPHPLAIFRVLFGCFLLFYWALQAPHAALMFSDTGLAMPLAHFSAPFGFLLLPLPPSAVFILFGTLYVCLLCLTVGIAFRVATLLAFVLYGYFMLVSMHSFSTSFDRIFLFMLLVLAFSGADRAFSLSMVLRRRSFFAWEPISILPQRLLAVQITATYAGVGFQKLFLESWQGGEVLANGFMGMWATPAAYAFLRLNLPAWFYDVSVFLVKAFEMTIPFALWIKQLRWWFFGFGTLFHLSIAVFLGIWWFLALVASYILFLTPEETHAWLRRRFPERFS